MQAFSHFGLSPRGFFHACAVSQCSPAKQCAMSEVGTGKSDLGCALFGDWSISTKHISFANRSTSVGMPVIRNFSTYSQKSCKSMYPVPKGDAQGFIGIPVELRCIRSPDSTIRVIVDAHSRRKCKKVSSFSLQLLISRQAIAKRSENSRTSTNHELEVSINKLHPLSATLKGSHQQTVRGNRFSAAKPSWGKTVMRVGVSLNVLVHRSAVFASQRHRP